MDIGPEIISYFQSDRPEAKIRTIGQAGNNAADVILRTTDIPTKLIDPYADGMEPLWYLRNFDPRLGPPKDNPGKVYPGIVYSSTKKPNSTNSNSQVA